MSIYTEEAERRSKEKRHRETCKTCIHEAEKLAAEEALKRKHEKPADCIGLKAKRRSPCWDGCACNGKREKRLAASCNNEICFDDHHVIAEDGIRHHYTGKPQSFHDACTEHIRQWRKGE